MRLLSATKLFYALATLASFLNGRGAGYERVHEYVSSTKRRLAVHGWVGSAVEYFSPQSRTAGGYGVVASVDSSTQVTLAAGYTLGAAGRCRLWDKSAGVHLDSGGVEWRRSGAVVTLPDTTGMAANDVIYSDRLEFNEYSHCTALETALGTAFNGELRLLNRSNGAVILRRQPVVEGRGERLVRDVGPALAAPAAEKGETGAQARRRAGEGQCRDTAPAHGIEQRRCHRLGGGLPQAAFGEHEAAEPPPSMRPHRARLP